MAARILEGREDTAAAVEVVTGGDGSFDAKVDDELVFTKSMLGRYPQPDDVVPLLREKLAAYARLYCAPSRM
jgi:predicted Rdx family selenoprotein